MAGLSSFERVGGLMSQRMPGGDLATRFPARMVAGIIWPHFGREKVERVLDEFCANGFKRGKREMSIVFRQLERDLNVFRTSSCGRVLDAIACLLGVCDERTYEGELAIKLEAAASKGDAGEVKLEPIIEKVGGVKVVDTSRLLIDLLSALRTRVPRRHIAAAAQRAIAKGLASIAIDAASPRRMGVVGGSGGVFYNWAITAAVRKEIEKAGLRFVQHELLPPGDGGISIGQAVVAARQYD